MAAAAARRGGITIVAGGHGGSGGDKATRRGRRHWTWPLAAMVAAARRGGVAIVSDGKANGSRLQVCCSLFCIFVAFYCILVFHSLVFECCT
ncbi:Os04g0470901 [Oryza sativa Japonica Group]|uniref:Os04g0470901 protein n=1 Tax=Oryza sativa subsp. japonica TaxID=39947 RepID=A0A0P0WBP3_ORYSJ|nr:hypothetical protein EE612_023878 [Oryza sativa]BAS89643.1 Os04g0470901 [Oryza sativa Japonica Group]